MAVVSASSKARSLHAQLKDTHLSETAPSVDQVGEWRKLAASVARSCTAQERRIAADRHRCEVEAAIMVEEMRSELVTREANAARTAERFRALSARTSGSDDTAYDRAAQTAAAIDASLRQMLAFPMPHDQSTEMLRVETNAALRRV